MTSRVVTGAVGLVIGWLAAGATAEPEKSQAVRVLDVLVIGPGLFAAALADRLEPEHRLVIAFVAGATVGYNARNLLDRARLPAS